MPKIKTFDYYSMFGAAPPKTKGKSMDDRHFTKVKSTRYKKRGEIQQKLPDSYLIQWDDNTVGMVYFADEGKTWLPVEVTTRQSKVQWADTLSGVNPGGIVEWDSITTPEPMPTDAELALMDADMAAFEAELAELEAV